MGRKLLGLLDVEEVSSASSLLHDLEKHIVDKSSERKVVSKTFKPSSMQCARNMFYQVAGAKITGEMYKPKCELVRIGECGSDSHERIQNWLISLTNAENSNWEYCDIEKFIKYHKLEDLEIRGKNGIETKLYNHRFGIPISFQTDGIIYNRSEDKYYVFEFKTEASRKNRERTGVDINHYDQAICYMLSFKIHTGTIFIYEDRDMLNHKAYLFEYNKQNEEELVKKIELVKEYLEKKKLPPKLIDEEKIKHCCQYCPYQKYCKTDNIGDYDE